MQNTQYSLPSYPRGFGEVFVRAKSAAIDKAIADMRSRVPLEKRLNRLRPAAQRFVELRVRDLRRAKMTPLHARAFAEAEGRLRQSLADIAGFDEIIDSSITAVRLYPNGALTVAILTFATFDEAKKIRNATGMSIPSPGDWTDNDLDPNARGQTH